MGSSEVQDALRAARTMHFTQQLESRLPVLVVHTATNQRGPHLDSIFIIPLTHPKVDVVLAGFLAGPGGKYERVREDFPELAILEDHAAETGDADDEGDGW